MKNSCLIFYTDEFFIKGLKCTLHSLFKHNNLSHVDIIILSDKRSTVKKLKNSKLISKSATKINKIKIKPYEEIVEKHPNWKKRFRKTFQKFEAFRRYGYDRNIFIDSDILCLGDISYLFDVELENGFGGVPDRGKENPTIFEEHHRKINTGVMLIDKKLQSDFIVNNLIKLSKQGKSEDGSDQGAINKFLVDNGIQPTELPLEYNTLKRVFKSKTFNKIKDRIKLLHFVGHKPWSDEKTPRHEQGYEQLNQMWRSNFREIKTS